jgi:hypothetical protein
LNVLIDVSAAGKTGQRQIEDFLGMASFTFKVRTTYGRTAERLDCA